MGCQASIRFIVLMDTLYFAPGTPSGPFYGCQFHPYRQALAEIQNELDTILIPVRQRELYSYCIRFGLYEAILALVEFEDYESGK